MAAIRTESVKTRRYGSSIDPDSRRSRSILLNGHGGQWRHPVGLLWPARWFNQQAAICAAFDPIACRMATTTNTTTTATTTTTGSTRIWVHGPAGSKMQGPKKSPLARWAQLGHINTPTFSSIASFSFSSRLRCPSHHRRFVRVVRVSRLGGRWRLVE